MEQNKISYHELNAMLNMYGADGKIQFGKDKEAAKAYFLDHVNQNTVFFHSLEEKLEYLVENQYYDKTILDQYSFEDIKDIFKHAYAYKFRFPTFVGAYKFYTQYALKNWGEETSNTHKTSLTRSLLIASSQPLQPS